MVFDCLLHQPPPPPPSQFYEHSFTFGSQKSLMAVTFLICWLAGDISFHSGKEVSLSLKNSFQPLWCLKLIFLKRGLNARTLRDLTRQNVRCLLRTFFKRECLVKGARGSPEDGGSLHCTKRLVLRRIAPFLSLGPAGWSPFPSPKGKGLGIWRQCLGLPEAKLLELRKS